MYRRTAGVIETELDDGLVLLNPANRQMYSLNKTGRTVWLNIGNLPVAAQALRNTYGLTQEQTEADIQKLVIHLESCGLIEHV